MTPHGRIHESVPLHRNQLLSAGLGSTHVLKATLHSFIKKVIDPFLIHEL